MVRRLAYYVKRKKTFSDLASCYVQLLKLNLDSFQGVRSGCLKRNRVHTLTGTI